METEVRLDATSVNANVGYKLEATSVNTNVQHQSDCKDGKLTSKMNQSESDGDHDLFETCMSQKGLDYDTVPSASSDKVPEFIGLNSVNLKSCLVNRYQVPGYDNTSTPTNFDVRERLSFSNVSSTPFDSRSERVKFAADDLEIIVPTSVKTAKPGSGCGEWDLGAKPKVY